METIGLFLERYHIWASLKQGRSQKEIAESIGVHTSTISREIHRNKDRTTEEYPNPSPSSTLSLTIIESLSLEYRHLGQRILRTEAVVNVLIVGN